MRVGRWLQTGCDRPSGGQIEVNRSGDLRTPDEVEKGMNIAEQATIPGEERLVGEAMRGKLDPVVNDGLIAGDRDVIYRTIGPLCRRVTTRPVRTPARRLNAEIPHESVKFVVIFVVCRHGQFEPMRHMLQAHLYIVARRIIFVNDQSIVDHLGM
jgi:hypothetical protein